MAAQPQVTQIKAQDGKIVSLEFSYQNKQYHAMLHGSNIVLSELVHGVRRGIVEHDVSSKVTQWRMEHVCGLSGFGAPGDVCYPHVVGEKIAETHKDWSMLKWHSKYKSELSDLIKVKLPGYCSGLEEVGFNIR